MPIIILDSHLSTIDKIDYIVNHEDKDTIFYLVFNSFTINDIDNLLSTSFNSNVNLVLTRTQNLKLDTHVVIKITNRFRIIYLNNHANTYHYQLLKPSNYFTMNTDNLIHYDLNINKHHLIGILEYINNQVNLDNKINNQQVRILSNKNVDNLPEEITNLEIIELSRLAIGENINDGINDKKSLAKMSEVNKKLKFLHISKCAGTIIEDIAKDEGIFWGRYDNTLNKDNLLKKWSLIKSDLYHLVPDCFEENIYNINKKTGLKTFCVVREPYSRIVSEVFCNWSGIFNHLENPTINDFNQYIDEYLDLVETRKNTQHWWPQHKYIYGENGNKMIDHILCFENLNKEFNDLMNQYNIPLQLNNQRVNSSKKLYGINDISNYNLFKINKIYNDDFDLSEQYKKINVSTLNKMEEQDEILIKNDCVVVLGLWNILNNEDINFDNVEKIIKRLINSNIFIYYDDENIKNKIIELNENKHVDFKNRLTFRQINIEKLPTYTLCENNIDTLLLQYPDILDEIKSFNELDKSKFNLNLYLKTQFETSNSINNLINSNRKLYTNIITVLTSKVLLLQDTIANSEFKYFNLIDLSVISSTNICKIRCSFNNIPFKTNKINLFKSSMMKKDKSIKYLTNFILSDRDTLNKFTDLYEKKIKECFNEKYLHDDETIIDSIRIDNPDLFCCID